MSLVPKNFYFDDFFDDFHPAPRMETMKCDVYEKDGKYNIEMDVPGYSKKDISIVFDDGLLTITAEKKYENNESDKDKKYIRRERHYGKMSRSFTFNDVDESNIQAEFVDGILKISVPKKTIENTKKFIEIN